MAVLTSLVAVVMLLSSLSTNADHEKSLLSRADSFIKKNFKEENREAISYQRLYTVEGNSRYVLYELSPIGYMIYDETIQDFSEFSFSGVSPYKYFDVDDKEKIYLCPQEYLVKEGNDYIDIHSKEKYSFDEVRAKEIAIDEMIQDDLLNDTSNDDSNATLIPRHSYFENLMRYPENINGSCAWTSLSMLLGYFDIFYNGDTVEDKYFEATQFSNGVSLTGLPTGMIDMPGTCKPFDDVIRKSRGYDVTFPSTLVDATEEYFDTISTTFKNQFTIDSIIWPLVPSQINSYIDSGWPYILLGHYTYIHPNTLVETTTNDHAVVAYGRNGNKYKVNFGWSDQNFNAIWTTSHTLGSGFGLKYNGEHICNISQYHPTICTGICSCTISNGIEENHSYGYIKFTYPYANNQQHRKICTHCKTNVWENHHMIQPIVGDEYFPVTQFCMYCGYGLA